MSSKQEKSLRWKVIDFKQAKIIVELFKAKSIELPGSQCHYFYDNDKGSINYTGKDAFLHTRTMDLVHIPEQYIYPAYDVAEMMDMLKDNIIQIKENISYDSSIKKWLYIPYGGGKQSIKRYEYLCAALGDLFIHLKKMIDIKEIK